MLIPAGREPFRVDTPLPSAIQPDEVEGDPAQDNDVVRAITDPHLALVFSEGHIQHPVPAVLDAPVTAYGTGELTISPSRLHR